MTNRLVGKLQRQTVGKGKSGGEQFSWPPEGEGEEVGCDVQPVSANMQMMYAQNQMQVDHEIYFAQDIGASPGDRFRVGTRIFKLQGYRPGAQGHRIWPSIMGAQEQPANATENP